LSATKEAVASKETITAKMARWPRLSITSISRRMPSTKQALSARSIGCRPRGYQQHDVKIALEVLDEIAGKGSATVIGTGKRIDPSPRRSRTP